MKESRVIIKGDAVHETCPLFEPIQFRANPKEGTEAPDVPYSLNTYGKTKFLKTTITGVPSIPEIVSQYCPSRMVMLSDLEAIYDRHQGAAYIIATEGDVTRLGREPLSSGNYLMTVDDESLGFEDAAGQPQQGVTCFVPGEQIDYLDFGEGSRVLVFATVTTAPGYNFETRSVDESKTRPILNVIGVYPVYKVAADEAFTLATEGAEWE